MEIAKKHPLKDKWTVKEYLEFEQTSIIRHEFHDGTLIPIEATTKNHNRIKRNVIRQLDTPQLEQSKCELFDENVITQLHEEKRYTYPDVVITCHADDAKDPLVIRHPSVIIEVLSKSTAHYDRTSKFFKYQRIPSLQQYVVISQLTCAVEVFLKDEKEGWRYFALDNMEATISVLNLGISCSLLDIYRNIVFEK